ncbi:hypothetical protein PTT_16707 [Pyrenophora teres f. teres 0-1]|uniref:Uncharacterized protein n=1 Tax=Pyrenophora teres f. teres (strain 0-1) TaxID=861557 RepID=E3S2V6_PYRTT|nr:hypothetical protein PTT_16707 [Pyrenophora teres f. teres 0-1]
MPERASFFTLSRELRDIIYEFYLIVESGYIFDYRSGKFIAVGGKPIDLALAYTCKAAATELRGLPLCLNTLHFFTSSSESNRSLLGRFGTLTRIQISIQDKLLQAARPCIDTQILDHVQAVYPQMLPVMHAIQQGFKTPRSLKGGTWGEVPSLYRQFVANTLKLISKRPEYLRELSHTVLYWMDPVLDDFVNMDQPWALPQETQLSPWIMEALALPSLGMPAQAFTLVLDGNPTPEATSRVFEIAQRDAEWQTASMEAFPPQNVDHGSAGWGNMVANHSYVMRGSELLSVSSVSPELSGLTELTS